MQPYQQGKHFSSGPEAAVWIRGDCKAERAPQKIKVTTLRPRRINVSTSWLQKMDCVNTDNAEEQGLWAVDKGRARWVSSSSTVLIESPGCLGDPIWKLCGHISLGSLVLFTWNDVFLIDPEEAFSDPSRQPHLSCQWQQFSNAQSLFELLTLSDKTCPRPYVL